VLIRITRKAAEHKNRPWCAQQNAAVKLPQRIKHPKATIVCKAYLTLYGSAYAQ